MLFPLPAMPGETTGTWEDDAGETCPFCHQGYAYELEVRCVDCDRPMCPLCAVRLRRRRLTCPQCDPAAAGDGKEA